MFKTFRHKNFTLLWLAGLISMIGNWIMIAALPFHVYEVTQSALATSGWLIAYILPGVLFGSLAGVYADRWDRRKLMVGVTLLQMAIVPCLLFVNSAETIWIVYVIGFIEATLSQFFAPAENALLPTLVDKDELVAANSLNGLNDNLGRILGPAIGGAALGMWGLSSVVLLDAASYLIAAVLIACMTIKPVEKSVEQIAEQPASFLQQWTDGLRLVRSDNHLVRLFSVLGFALFGDAILSAILIVFMQGHVGMSAAEVGWAFTARGIGGLIGGGLMAQFGTKLPRHYYAGLGLVLSGLAIIVLISMPTPTVMVIGTGVIGVPAMMWIIAFFTMLQEATTDEYRGRIFGTYGTTAAFLMLLGSLVGGGLADLVGSPILVTAAGMIYMIAGVLAWILVGKETSSAETPSPSIVEAG